MDDDRYRLVFRGEVLPDQHPAVVRKRLKTLLKIDDDERLDRLFSGSPVVLRRNADTRSAAQLQAAFKKAGARLRVLPVDAGDGPSGRAPEPRGPGAAPPPAEQPVVSSASSPSGLALEPVGADMLKPGERAAEAHTDIDVGHLALAPGDPVPVAGAADASPAPDVSHITVAEPGAPVGVDAARPQPPPLPEVDFDLAEPGVILIEAEEVLAEVDLTRIHFDVAEVGAVIADQDRPPPPPAPDTSHLGLEEADPPATT